MEIRAGQRLGPYEIVERIGAGGMGEVWRATDTRLDRAVAVKVLPQDLAADQQFLSRFEREAKTISALNHPNICTLHDVGQSDSTHYLVMELIDGETLADRLVKGRLPLEQVLRYGMDIAAALDAAHRRGIVHRDLKPANIMLTRSGAKLLDFGLAKPSAIDMALDGPTQHKPLTREGTIVGTFQYMAPEQLEGMEADARTDIFSFGAVLYEMATGRRAFEGQTRTSLIAAIVAGSPRPIASIDPVTPDAFQHIVDKCLEKDPNDRWQSAHDVRIELDWVQTTPRPGAEPGTKKGSWMAWSLAGLALLVAAMVFWIAARPSAALPRRVTHLLAPGSDGFDSLLESLTISPDGRYVTFRSGNDERLWLRSLDSPDAKALAGTEGGRFPFWSPDSRTIAFFADAKLKKVAINGTPPVTICDAPEGRPGGWNENGVILFSPDTQAPIHQVSSKGGASRPVTKLDAKSGETTHRWVRFLPDGNHFLFMGGAHGEGATSERNAVYVASLDNPSARLLTRARSNALYSAGHLLYARGNTLLAHPFDLRKRELTGEVFTVASDVNHDASYFRSVFDATASGDLVFHSSRSAGASRLAWMERGSGVSEAFGEPQSFRGIQLSHDGRRMVAQIADAKTGLDDLWLYDLQRGTRSRFTATPGDSEASPVWSRDGLAIAFMRGKAFGGGTSIVVRKEVSSGRETVLLTGKDREVAYPSDWSADGRFILITLQDAGRGSDVMVLDLTRPGAASPITATAAREFNGLLSSDQRWMAYTSDESGRQEVYVVSFPAGDQKTQVSQNGGFAIHWGGERLTTGLMGKVLQYPVKTSLSGVSVAEPTATMKVPREMVMASTIDGSRFLIVRREQDRADETITLISPWPLASSAAAQR